MTFQCYYDLLLSACTTYDNNRSVQTRRKRRDLNTHVLEEVSEENSDSESGEIPVNTIDMPPHQFLEINETRRRAPEKSKGKRDERVFIPPR